MGKPRKRSPELLKLAVELYEKLGSGNAAAKRLDVSPPTLYAMLKEAGVHVPGWQDEKPRRQALSGDKADAVVSDYLSGLTLAQLEEKWGVGQYAIRAAVKRAGHTLRDHGGQRRRVTKEEGARMAFLYEDGLSQAQIGAAFNAGQPVVSKVLRERGVKVRGPQRGHEKSFNWRGGVSETGNGYILEYVPPNSPFVEMATRSGYVMQHRLRMAESLGRCLSKNESVHHINGDHKDNRIENLQLRQGKHGKGVCLQCADCGSVNLKYREIT